MALRHFDGYGTYNSTTSAVLKYDAGSSIFQIVTGRRASSKAAQLNHEEYLTKTFDDQSTFIVGSAVRASNVLVAGSIFTFSTAAGEQISLRRDASAQLYVSRNGTTLWTSGSDPVYRMVTGTYLYLEFKATFDTSSGSWALRINGSNSTLVSGSGVNTAAQGGTVARKVTLHGLVSNNHYYGDSYVCDGSGSAPYNDFLGDCRIDVLVPSGAGTYNDFTLSSGVDAYALLDDNPHNSDTDYISSNTLDHKTTVAMADLPYTPTHVYGLSIVDYSRKDNTGSRDVAHIVRTNSTDIIGASRALSTTYGPGFTQMVLNPVTGLPFTVNEINALECGIKVTG